MCVSELKSGIEVPPMASVKPMAARLVCFDGEADAAGCPSTPPAPPSTSLTRIMTRALNKLTKANFEAVVKELLEALTAHRVAEAKEIPEGGDPAPTAAPTAAYSSSSSSAPAPPPPSKTFSSLIAQAVYRKAVAEAQFGALYALLCLSLSTWMGHEVAFVPSVINLLVKPDTRLQGREVVAKAVFAAELFKVNLLPEQIIHVVLRRLVGTPWQPMAHMPSPVGSPAQSDTTTPSSPLAAPVSGSPFAPAPPTSPTAAPPRTVEFELEAACTILQSVGPQLDSTPASHLVSDYVARLASAMQAVPPPASTRVKFMMQDVVEKHRNRWWAVAKEQSFPPSARPVPRPQLSFHLTTTVCVRNIDARCPISYLINPQPSTKPANAPAPVIVSYDVYEDTSAPPEHKKFAFFRFDTAAAAREWCGQVHGRDCGRYRLQCTVHSSAGEG